MDDSALHFGDPGYGVIVPFLRGSRPDWESRWLREIRSWGFDRLEDDHHYIQWLFPLPVESEVVMAPVLREGEIHEIRSTPQLRAELACSLRQLLAFYGYALIDGPERVVVHAPNHAERVSLWMTAENHNYHRISRILQCLSLLGLTEHAAAFYRRLMIDGETERGAAQIGALTRWHWRKSVEQRP